MENPVMKNGATGRCKVDCPLLCAQAKADETLPGKSRDRARQHSRARHSDAPARQAQPGAPLIPGCKSGDLFRERDREPALVRQCRNSY